MIMAFQEIALNYFKGYQQNKFVEQNFVYLLNELNYVLNRLPYVWMRVEFLGQTDDFSSCIIYDNYTWELVKTIHIQREGSEKRSNAYLLKGRRDTHIAGREIVVVNIHLAAKAGSKAVSVWTNRVTSYVSPTEGETSFEELHVNELHKILRETLMGLEGNKPPIFIVGDFNNTEDKHRLLQLAFDKLKQTNPELTR